MTGRMPRILVLGTLDTKGEEFAFLKDEILRAGCEAVVMDLGILGRPLFEADIPRDEVVAASGHTLAELSTGAKRGDAIRAAIDGGIAITARLFAEGGFDAVIGMGGGSGTTITTTIMETLPFGMPKLVVTTLSHLKPHVHGTDVVVVRTLVDLVGLNPITRVHLRQAAAAIAGMARAAEPIDVTRKSVVITCLGVTTPGVMRLRQLLRDRGKEVIVLHWETESVRTLLEAGVVEAFVDLTPNEILRDMVYPPGPDDENRLRALRESGVPVLLSAGALDMIIQFVPAGTVPEGLEGRPSVVHSPDASLFRTTADEQRRAGRVLGAQLAATQGPRAAVLPMGGFSAWDAPGRTFEQPEAREAFAAALAESAPDTTIRRVEAAINDEEFAEAVLAELLTLLGEDR